MVWLCVSTFVGSFVGLLLLSATALWSPGNPWILVLDGAWRASLAIGAMLWLVPRLVQGTRWLRDFFSGHAEGA